MIPRKVLPVCLLLPLLVAGGGHFETRAESSKEEKAGPETEGPADPEEDEKPVGEEPPERTWRETVSVSGELEGATAAPIGSSSTRLDPTSVPGTPATVADLVVQVPAVSQNGQGGHFQVVSIRGVSRNRVRSLIAGMRANSDRRAGPTISFIDPLLLDSVEVLRGPATTLHGSGALGGVIEVSPKSHEGGSVRFGYDTRGGENYQVVGYGQEHWSVGFARRDAGDARAPDGTLLDSHFTQYSATVAGRWKEGPRSWEVSFVPTRGEDIGKPTTDSPGRTTNYPLERHHMLKLGVQSQAGWNALGYLHGHDLETDVLEIDVVRSQVLNDSLDYGAAWSRDVEVRDDLDVRWGVQADGRHDVNAEETRVDLQPGAMAPVQRSRTLNGAGELEAGGYATLTWNPRNTALEVGTRLSWIRQANEGFSSKDRSAINGFAGLTHRFGKRAEIRGALSSGLRFPSLSEQFFTGTTGAGSVTGNSNLSSERALNAEISFRWVGTRLLIDGGVFRNDVDDYIARVEVMPDVLEFVNLPSARIHGVELQAMVVPANDWKILFGGHAMEGRSDAGEPIADIPPDAAFAGFEYRRKAWSCELRLTHRWAKTDPGPREKVIPAAWLLQARVDVRLSDAWSLGLTGANLLDEEYFPAADRKAALAPERSVGFQVVWQSR